MTKMGMACSNQCIFLPKTSVKAKAKIAYERINTPPLAERHPRTNPLFP